MAFKMSSERSEACPRRSLCTVETRTIRFPVFSFILGAYSLLSFIFYLIDHLDHFFWGGGGLEMDCKPFLMLPGKR